ncbi:hypothetical protein IWX47DRAFT_867079 [Phyllosticta citricarpa]|uniref:Uncharacterized protein n=1 Tax=Phyllosticta citricarpa TaxID=55181 RepID=A0ABR1L3B0_9PEZI
MGIAHHHHLLSSQIVKNSSHLSYSFPPCYGLFYLTTNETMPLFEFLRLRSLLKALRKKSRRCEESDTEIECPSAASFSPFASQTPIIRAFERPRPLTAQHFYANADANSASPSYTPSKTRMVSVQDGPHERAAILPTQDFTRHVQEALEAKRHFFCLLEGHACVEKKVCRRLWEAWERYCRLHDGVDIALEEVWIGCGLLEREPRLKVFAFDEDLWEGEEGWASDEEQGCGFAEKRPVGPPVLPELPFAREGEGEREDRPFIPIFPASGGAFDAARSGCAVPRLLVVGRELEKPRLTSLTRPGSEMRRRLTKSLRRKRRVHWDEQNLGKFLNRDLVAEVVANTRQEKNERGGW